VASCTTSPLKPPDQRRSARPWPHQRRVHRHGAASARCPPRNAAYVLPWFSVSLPALTRANKDSNTRRSHSLVTGPRLEVHRSCELRLFLGLGGVPLLAECFGSEEVQRSVGPVCVVLDAPVLGKHLGLGQRVELFADEEFIAESPVERLADPVLPR